jgi:hypothetical protein
MRQRYMTTGEVEPLGGGVHRAASRVSGDHLAAVTRSVAGSQVVIARGSEPNTATCKAAGGRTYRRIRQPGH